LFLKKNERNNKDKESFILSIDCLIDFFFYNLLLEWHEHYVEHQLSLEINHPDTSAVMSFKKQPCSIQTKTFPEVIPKIILQSLIDLDSHFMLNDFLVGSSYTVADAYLTNFLAKIVHIGSKFGLKAIGVDSVWGSMVRVEEYWMRVSSRVATERLLRSNKNPSNQSLNHPINNSSEAISLRARL